MAVCAQCRQEYSGDGIMITADADFVCSEECKKNWEAERDWFLNIVVHSEQRTEDYIMGRLSYVGRLKSGD